MVQNVVSQLFEYDIYDIRTMCAADLFLHLNFINGCRHCQSKAKRPLCLLDNVSSLSVYGRLLSNITRHCPVFRTPPSTVQYNNIKNAAELKHKKCLEF